MMNSRKKAERIFKLLDSMLRVPSPGVLVFRVNEKSNSSLSALQHCVLQEILTLSILQVTWAMFMRLQEPSLSPSSRTR